MLEVGALMYGFLVKSVTDLPDVEGRMWRFMYEKNGAELVWLERKDEVKTFVIAFKTLPEDDTGVAHILEHSVLSGSGKYPVKSPFDELRKSSLRVFMNAMTGRDRTYYPFSTRNNQDFLNLADVYLDAVFDPNVMRSPLAFRQEGWHYKIDEKTGELSVNGVVYNEMKGVFADPERTAERDVLGYLYPDTVYGNDSGGKPESIPDLTYGKFCAFYKKFYHPSNARIFLDGSVDLSSILSKLDGYLSRYEKSQPAVVPVQKPVRCSKRILYGATDCERKTILVDAWSVGNYSDIDKRAMLDVLEYYLAGSNESPLKKALLEDGLCEDAKLYWYAYQQMPMVLVIRNTTDEAAVKCREVVRRTLTKLLEKGLDRKRLHAIIDKNEFAEREVNTSRPRGLAYFAKAFGQWHYGGDPVAEFDISGIYSRLRKGVDAGAFEKCLREILLENPHHVELTFSPDSSLLGEPAKRIEEELARRKSEMREEAVAKLTEECREIAGYQARKDSAAAKASIPALKVSDIPAKGHIVEHSVCQEGDITVIKTKPTCKGVVYITMYFPIDALGADELVKIPLLARLYGKLPTAKYDALTLQTELMSTVGRVSASTVASQRGNYFRVSVAVLESKVVKAIELLKEVLFETRFDDRAAVGKIHKQKLNSAERKVRTRGDAIADRIASRSISRRWASADVLHGFAQLRWLQKVEITDGLLEELKKLADKIFVRNGMVFSYTDNMSNEAQSRLKTMFPVSDGKMMDKAEIPVEGSAVGAIKIDGDTGYSGTVAALPEGRPFDGSMMVAAKVVSLEHLYKQIREIGGAYGTGMSITPSGLVTAYTYRNPTPVKSQDVILKSAEALRVFLASDRELDRYIVATVSGMDPYLSPVDEAFAPVELYMNGRTFVDFEATRQQIIGTEKKDLVAAAEMLDSILPAAEHVVVGGDRQTEGLPAEKVERLELGRKE